jgi:hypothetical protein
MNQGIFQLPVNFIKICRTLLTRPGGLRLTKGILRRLPIFPAAFPYLLISQCFFFSMKSLRIISKESQNRAREILRLKENAGLPS